MISDMDKKDISELLVNMAQTASFIRSKHFKKTMQSKEHRFDNDLSPIFKNLRADLEFQMQQGIATKELTPDSEVNGRPYHSAETMAKLTADEIDKSITKIAKYYDVAIHAKSKGKFIVPKDRTPSDVIFEKFNLDKMEDIIAGMIKLDTPLSSLGTFYKRNSMISVSLYVESINTLRCDTYNTDFERILKELIQDPSYFTNGCAHDILAHDAKLVRECKDLIGIAIKTEYSSSKAIFKDQGATVPEGSIYHQIRHAGTARKAYTASAMGM